MSITKPSVQSLLIQMRFNNQILSVGTGFTVITSKGPALITNRHNVTGRHQETGQPLSKTGGIPNEINIVHNRKGLLGQWIPRTESLFDINGKSLWIEHPTLQEKADFVAIPLSQLNDIELYPYDLSDTGPEIFVGPSDPVSVVGFPFGIQGGGSLAIWATGFMASEPDIDFNGLPIVLIDCKSRPGQSGSAVIAQRNGGMVGMKDGGTAAFSGPITKFLGIYSGRINNQSDIGIVWKSSAIKELVDSF